MSGVTNIDDLPIVGGNQNSNPVQLEAKEKPIDNVKINNDAEKLKQQRADDMNTLVTEIQKASSGGTLGLPSRDIPQSQEHITQDNQTKANYIPTEINDYIGNEPTKETIIKEHNKREKQIKEYDDIFDILQIPAILAILYFAFQTPYIRKMAYKNLSFLFEKDGNYSTFGTGVMSILFAGSYVALTNAMEYMSI